MSNRVKKKEDIFYTHFKTFAAKTLEGAQEFCDLIDNYPEDREKKVKDLITFEHECDMIVHDILMALNDAFITPFDREDISAIVRMMDDVADGIMSSAKRYQMFDVHEVLPSSIEVAHLILACAEEQVRMFDNLPDMKKSKSPILDSVIEINRLENEGDDIYEDALSGLFRSESDAMHLIKWIRIHDRMETTLDAFEHCANMVSGVVSKNA